MRETAARSGRDGCRRGLCQSLVGGVPAPRQQFIDLVGRVIGQLREHMGKPSLRIDVVEFAGFDERKNVSGPSRAFVRAGEGPVAPAHGNAAQPALGGVVGHADASIIEEAGERRPAIEAVVDRLANVALG